MLILDSLTSIRGIWISRVSRRLARGEGIRESFQEQLEIFYDQLIQCVASGNPTWLDPVVDEWVQAQTVSELEDKSTSLPPILDQFLQITCSVARENLTPEAALDLVEAVLPAYQHMTRLAYELETERHVEHISRELERARLSLEHLDKNKSDFISIAAHELKTPLTLIEGYASMLAEVVGRDPDQVEVMLKGIDNGTRRLTEIIDDMIDVSMIDNDLLSLNFQPVWLNRILDAIQHEVRKSWRIVIWISLCTHFRAVKRCCSPTASACTRHYAMLFLMRSSSPRMEARSSSTDAACRDSTRSRSRIPASASIRNITA